MAIVWPDIEAVLVSSLKASLAGRAEPFSKSVHVSNKMPAKPDGTPTRFDRMVIVRDDSGSQLDVVRDLVRVGVQFWGGSREEAKDLSELGRALLNGLGGVGPIARIRCAMRPVFVEDAQPMFYATFELVVKGSSL